MHDGGTTMLGQTNEGSSVGNTRQQLYAMDKMAYDWLNQKDGCRRYSLLLFMDGIGQPCWMDKRWEPCDLCVAKMMKQKETPHAVDSVRKQDSIILSRPGCGLVTAGKGGLDRKESSKPRSGSMADESSGFCHVIDSVGAVRERGSLVGSSRKRKNGE